MLSETLIYYCQVIFFLTLTSDIEYHRIVCELDRKIECVVNLNVTWLGFVSVLVLFLHMHGWTRDLGLLVGPKTQDSGAMGPGTWDLRPGTWNLRPGIQLIGGCRDPRPETWDPGSGFSANFLSFLWNMAFMNKFMCFMRLCLFCMFLITLS